MLNVTLNPNTCIYICSVRFVTFILLVVFLVASTELNQFLKLPLLVEHYNEHKDNDGKTDFISFLYIHYSGTHPDNGDSEKDAQLPFKSCQSTLQFSAPIPSSTQLIKITSDYARMVEKVYALYKDVSLMAQYLSSIWQPPKTVE